MKRSWDDTNQQALKSLFQALTSLKTAEQAQQFLTDLCTPTELQSLTDRWWVVNLLKQNKSYRDIADETGVSLTTIGRVARTLEMGEGGYAAVLERIHTKK